MMSAPLDEEELGAVLARLAPSWFDCPGPGSAAVVSTDRRNQSILVRARIECGGQARDVIVKMPLAVTPAHGDGRLIQPVTDPIRKAEFEYRTLMAVDEAVKASADPRFGRARAFGYLPDFAALVVGLVPGRTLDRRLRSGGWGASDAARRRQDIERTGALLSVFHSASTPHMVERDGTAAAVVAGVGHLIGHLRESTRLGLHADRIVSALSRFPEHPPGWPPSLVLGHGDLAPRNVFIDDDGTVTLIDSLGRFQVPPQEDVAYLLVELSTGGARRAPAALRRPRAWNTHCREAVLAGYPMQDDPVLWLFELRALLDKWRSLADRQTRRADRPTGAGRGGAVLGSAQNRLRQLLIEREVVRVTAALEREL